MDETTRETELMNAMHERYLQLPKIVQDAITSADVERQLRELSEGHKLHLDQWDKLQTEVMLALLGFQQVEHLAENIANNVGIEGKEAEGLATDISRIVFEPIRLELERGLGHPEAKSATESMSEVEKVRNEVLSQNQSRRPLSEILPVSKVSVSPAPAATDGAVKAVATPPIPTARVAPATPPAPAPEAPVERAPIPTSYVNTASTERKDITGDPYREQV